MLLFICFFTSSIFSQSNNFQIKELESEVPVSFAKIKSADTVLIADLDGKFSLKSGNADFTVKMIGYQDSTFKILPNVSVYYLRPILQTENEVTVIAGENPAHRIIELAIANRKKNHPLENDAFTYESYSKFTFDSNPDDLQITDSLSQTQRAKLKNFIENNHFFLNETQSIRSYRPPARDHEEIIAFKTAGFDNPLFATFARELQAFNFYDNQFSILGKNYLNPIAAGGTKRYLFILEDSLINGSDTTFTISFRPRIGKNFDGMSGVIYINTNQYAVEKVIAAPSIQSQNYDIQIIQEYAFTNNYKWFPEKLSTELVFKNEGEGIKSFDGKGNIYISKVVFNPENQKFSFFNNEEITTADNAGDLKDNEWEEIRAYELNEKDKNTYQVLDSLGEVHKFDEKLDKFILLSQGKIPIKKFNLDLTRVFNYNQYEGYRFGLGLETSERLSKAFKISGYFGWATRDKEFKYGGKSEIFLYKKQDLKLIFLYQQDIAERGGYQFTQDAFNINNASLARRFYIEQMDRQSITEVALSGLILSNLKLKIFGNYQRISMTDSIYFPTPLATLYYDLAEVGAEIIWNIREKVMRLGNLRVSKGTDFPKLSFLVKKGISGIYDSEYNYMRYAVELNQDVKLKAFGTFSWLIQASATEGDVPLFLMQTPYATGGNFNLTVPNTLETLEANTFYNRKQASVFTRLYFNQMKTKVKWSKPQFFLHHGLAFGDFERKENYSGLMLRSLDKGYYEAGGGIYSLLVTGFSGIGIGVFYNYGYYSQAKVADNLTYKITVKFNF